MQGDFSVVNGVFKSSFQLLFIPPLSFAIPSVLSFLSDRSEFTWIGTYSYRTYKDIKELLGRIENFKVTFVTDIRGSLAINSNTSTNISFSRKTVYRLLETFQQIALNQIAKYLAIVWVLRYFPLSFTFYEINANGDLKRSSNLFDFIAKNRLQLTHISEMPFTKKTPIHLLWVQRLRNCVTWRLFHIHLNSLLKRFSFRFCSFLWIIANMCVFEMKSFAIKSFLSRILRMEI